LLRFVESPVFTERVVAVWSDDDLAAFQRELAAHPTMGDVIPGLGGFRKLRWAAKGKGKRGGARIIYLPLPRAGIVYLFYFYTKGDMADLSAEQKRRLRRAVAEIKAEFET
jgi:hypothetical protein